MSRHEVRLDIDTFQVDEIWMKTAWREQQEIFRQLGDRSSDQLNLEHMKEKVKIALNHYRFNSPSIIKNVTDAIIKISNSPSFYYISFVFIDCLKLWGKTIDFRYVVFRIGDPRSNSFIYIDTDCRKYDSWDDFIKNNILPNCVMIYPKGGCYYNDGNLLKLVMGKSPGLLFTKALSRVTNCLSAVGGILAGTVLLTNPVSAPVLLGASAVTLITGAHSVKSGLEKLMDIKRHNVNGLSIANSETQLALLDVGVSAASSVTVGASSALKGFAVKSGRVFTESSLAYRIVNNVPKITKTTSRLQLTSNVAYLLANIKKMSEPEYKIRMLETLLFGFNVYLVGSEIEAISTVELIEYISKDVISFLPKMLIKNIREVNNEHLKEFVANFVPHVLFVQLAGRITESIDRLIEYTIKLCRRQISLSEFAKQCAPHWDNIINTLKKMFHDSEESDSKSPFGTLLSSSRNVNILEQRKNISLLKAEIMNVVKDHNTYNDKELLDARVNTLFYTVSYLVNSSNALSGKNDVIYDLLKMQFVCRRFTDILTCMKEDCYYQCFKSTLFGSTEEEYIRSTFQIVPDYLNQFIFDSSLAELKKSWKSIDEEFNEHYKTLTDEQKNDRHKLYLLTVPNRTKLSKNEYYEQLSQIEELSGQFQLSNSDFIYSSEHSAVIKSKIIDSQILFYTCNGKSDLECVVVHFE